MKAMILAAGLLACAVPNSTFAAKLDLAKPCDLDQSTLGPAFEGHSVANVYAALKAVGLEKDEYETTEQFEDRKAQALTKLPAAIANGRLCIVKEPYEEKYDADKAELALTPFFVGSDSWFDGKDIHRSMKLTQDTINHKSSSYLASNAYGATAEVTKTKWDSFVVAFDYDLFTKMLKGVGREGRVGFELPVSMEPARARALKGKILIALEYRVVRPYASEYTDYETPKLDNPFESENRQFIVSGEPFSAVVFDKTTGDVLVRFNLERAGQTVYY